MRATRYDRYRRAQNADHFAHNSPFSAFFAEVVCTLGMTPPRTAISPPPKGVCTTSMESTARPAGPGCGTRGLRCPWAAAGPGRASHSDTSAAGAEGAGGHGGHGRASRRRAQPRTATQAPPVWRVPTGPEGCGARLRGPWAAAGPGRASRRRAQPHTATQAPPVWRVPEGTEGQAAGPVGGSGAWPGFKTTRPATHSDTSAAGVEGAGGHGGPGCGAHGRGEAWPGFKTTRPATHSDTSAAGVEGAGGSGGPGRASRSTTPSRRLACGDLAGGRARRHPEHRRHHKQDHQPSSPPPTGTPSSPAPAHTLRRMPTHHPGITKPPGPIGAGRQWR